MLSAQELLNLNLVNDKNISLSVIAKNPQFPWNPVTLSLHRKLTRTFVDDHPELPWDEKIISSRFDCVNLTSLTSSISNRPNIELTELLTYGYDCGLLSITVIFHVVNGSQGVILTQFDNEFYYFCQLDIDGKNPGLIPDDKRTQELSQLDSVHVDYLTEKAIKKIDKKLLRSTWYDLQLKSLVNNILRLKMNDDIHNYKRNVLSKLPDSNDRYIKIIEWICQSEYTSFVDYVVRSILKSLINPLHRLNATDLAYVLRAIIDLDYTIEQKLDIITQFVSITKIEDNQYVARKVVRPINNALNNWPGFDLEGRYKFIRHVIKKIDL